MNYTIQYIGAFALFFLINWLVWLVVEKWQLVPEWLEYKPFICRTCATFWVLISVAAGLALLGQWVGCVALSMLAVANLAAMLINDRNQFGD